MYNFWLCRWHGSNPACGEITVDMSLGILILISAGLDSKIFHWMVITQSVTIRIILKEPMSFFFLQQILPMLFYSCKVFYLVILLIRKLTKFCSYRQPDMILDLYVNCTW